MGLFVSCFAANGTVFLPAPSSAIVTGFAAVFPPVLTGIIGGCGSACGELIGYMAGRGSGQFITSEKYLRYVKNFYDKHGNIAVFLFALLPLPLFDIVGFNAGAAKMNVLVFSSLCMTGKIIKMLFYAFFGAWLYSFLRSFPLIASFI
jgi:membrane protein YqaA with SNARE-associated domain